MTNGAPGGARRRGRPGYDMESVLRISVDVFTAKGFDGTSMEDLAQALGVSKSAIYHHVASKEDLLRMALDRALDGLSLVVAGTREVDGRAIDRLAFLVRGSVRTLIEQLPFVTLLLRVHGNTKVERRALARRRAIDHYVAELVTQGQEEGDIRTDVDAVVTSRLLFGMVNSLTEWVRPRDRTDIDRLADSICAVAFDGLRLLTPSPI